jgi:hypothetical protein
MVRSSAVAGAAALVALAMGAQARALLDRHEAAGVDCVRCHAGAPDADPGHAPCVACHGSMVDGPVPAGPDPHHSPHLAAGAEPDCTSCHSVHGAGEVTCSFCHRGFEFTLD